MSALIKWTGSKSSQAKAIVDLFPSTIDTYYEPFIGGGSVLYEVLERCEQHTLTVKKFVCSDKNVDLINIYKCIKYNPEYLLNIYTNLWNGLKSIEPEYKRKFYEEQRNKYNNETLSSTYKACLFYWLLRTCFNGLVRYNKNGNFNSPFHHNRDGMNPSKLEPLIMKYHHLFNKFDIIFKCESYIKVQSLSKNDVMYLDPPYINTSSMYFADGIKYDMFFNWIRKNECNIFLSFDGIRDTTDLTFEIPTDVYNEHLYIQSGLSSFSKLVEQNNKNVKESLYIKRI